MEKFALLLALTLVSQAIWAADPRSSDDLRYCLELKSDYEIAKCAGEISPGPKGKPMSRTEAEKMIEKQSLSAPVGPAASSVPATQSGQPGRNLLPAKIEPN